MPRLLFALPGLLAVCLLAAAAQAQSSEPASTAPPAAATDEFKLPNLGNLRLNVPRPVKAATAALGFGRQRLALVVGLGAVGKATVLANASRDSQAVAALLRDSGFVVMLREDLGSADLRASLKELQDRLQPGGLGFVYICGLGVQLDGQNVLLPRDAALDPSEPAERRLAQWRKVGLPLAEVVNALQGTDDSPRLLVLDSAYRHPALAGLPAQGLAAQRLPPGVIALFAQGLGAQQDAASTPPLPDPPPNDPRQIAASAFTRSLVAALMVPRIKGPEALRATRKAIFDASLGQVDPWLAGDTDASEEFAEAGAFDSIVPQTPEDAIREATKQLSRSLTRTAGNRAAAAGEQSVADVLQQAAQQPVATPAAPAGAPNAPAPTAQPADSSETKNARPNSARNANADSPSPSQQSPSADSTRAPRVPSPPSASSALGTAASTAGSAAGVAGTVAATAAALKVAEASAASSVASTVIGAAASLATDAVAALTRSGAAASAEPPAAEAAQRVIAAARPATAAATPVAAPASPVAATPTPAAAAPMAVAAPGPIGPVASAMTPALRAAAASPPAAPAMPGQPVALDGRTMRHADGGERPVYTPRSNSFGYTEGDTFSYQVIDTWKGEITGNYTTAIEEVLDNGQLLANGHQQQLDAQGRLTRQTHPDGTVSQYEPAQQLWWSNPKRGESRDVSFTETRRNADRVRGEIEWRGSTSVGRPRKIELPGGEFEVVPIEGSGWYYESLADGSRTSVKWSRTVWYSPRLGHPVAIDIEDTDRVGKLLKRERVELLHAQSARNAP